MDRDEFSRIAGEMQARWWSYPIPPAALDQYLADLQQYPAELVAAAVATFAADGAERAPTVGQLHRRIAELTVDAPSWSAARTVLLGWRAGRDRRTTAAWECPAGTCDGSGMILDEEANVATDCSCRPAMLAAARGLDELPGVVREFVEARHVTAVELDALLAGGDTTLEAQVRGRWQEFTGRAVQSAAYADLPGAGGVPRLDAARDEVGERERGLRRLDPAAAIRQLMP